MSAAPLRERVLALAGLLQALRCVQRVANEGDAPGTELDASLASVFRIDADSTEAVYGSVALLEPGLRAVIAQLEGGGERDPALSRMAVTVLHVERKLIQQGALLRAIRDGVNDTARQREHFGIAHPTVLARLADTYANTVSTLAPRVLVQGNPAHLGQAEVVARIRALLLAAIRSTVLWRQLGGSYWDLVLRRRAMVQAARQWLSQAD
jgi:high frequency lysogenization protein